MVFDACELLDTFQVDDELRFDETASDLSKQIRSTGQERRSGTSLLEQPRQRLGGGRFLVCEVHVCPMVGTSKVSSYHDDRGLKARNLHQETSKNVQMAHE